MLAIRRCVPPRSRPQLCWRAAATAFSTTTATPSTARGFSGRTVVAATAVGAIGAAMCVRKLMLPAHDPYTDRPDGSQARIAIQPQAERVVRVLYHDKEGVPKLARVDEAAFGAEAERRATEIEQARGPLLASASSSLHRLLDDVFESCQGPDRVAAFASWYYAYSYVTRRRPPPPSIRCSQVPHSAPLCVSASAAGRRSTLMIFSRSPRARRSPAGPPMS